MVNTPILSSTLLLTMLSIVGLIFFIRASVKERTKQVKLISPEPEDSLLTGLQQYFEQRAYQMTAIDSARKQVTFEGFVRPSWFLAIFLTFLAACGLFCLALVLSFLYPSGTNLFLPLTLLAPAAGFFYWQKAGRRERVCLQVEALDTSSQGKQSLITVTGHKDELTQLQQSLPFVAVCE